MTGGASNGDADVVIEYSEFDRNGIGSGQAHQMYIGDGVKTLTVQYCYIHDANSGQGIKSRAEKAYILYNRITDETDGNYNIDLSNGGEAWIVGNILEQGNGSDNSVMMTYGVEAHWILRIKNGGMTEPSAGTRIIGRTSGAQCLIPQDRFCQVDCSGEGTGAWLNHDRATGIQCWHLSGTADSTPDWIAGEILDLYQFDGKTLIESDWANARSAEDPPTYLTSSWKEPFKSLPQKLYIVNNTIINNNTDWEPCFLHTHVAADVVQMTNNIIYNHRSTWKLLYENYGASIVNTITGVYTESTAYFSDFATYDVHLVVGDSAIDTGSFPLVYNGFDCTPQYEYVHPYSRVERRADGALDIGAYEYDTGKGKGAICQRLPR